jgi:cell division protein FtsB
MIRISRENAVIAILVLVTLGGVAYFVNHLQSEIERSAFVLPKVDFGISDSEAELVKSKTEIAKLAAEIYQLRSDTSGSLFWLKMIALFVTVGGAVGGYLLGLSRTTQQKLEFEDRKNVDQVYHAIIQELSQPQPILRATAAVKLGSILESFPKEWAVKGAAKNQIIKRTKQVLAAALAIESDEKVLKTITIALPLHKPWKDLPEEKAKEKYGDMSGLDLSSAKAKDAYWARVDFSYADFYKAELQGASFRNAILNDAQFRESQLQNGVLIEADCKGANFKMADLSGADFTGAKNLDAAKFNQTIYNDATIFPEGFNKQHKGLILQEAK